jgi:hypothetical protein
MGVIPQHLVSPARIQHKILCGTAYRMRCIPCHASCGGHGGQAWAIWDGWNGTDKGSDKGSANSVQGCPEEEIAGPARSDPVCLSVGPGSHQRDGFLIRGLGREVCPTARQVEHPQARTAVRASPRRQAALIGQELDRADMLGRIAVPPVALMVAVDRMPAGAVGRWARGHRHLTSGRQPGAGAGAASFTRAAAIVFLSVRCGQSVWCSTKCADTRAGVAALQLQPRLQRHLRRRIRQDVRCQLLAFEDTWHARSIG